MTDGSFLMQKTRGSKSHDTAALKQLLANYPELVSYKHSKAENLSQKLLNERMHLLETFQLLVLTLPIIFIIISTS